MTAMQDDGRTTTRRRFLGLSAAAVAALATAACGGDDALPGVTPAPSPGTQQPTPAPSPEARQPTTAAQPPPAGLQTTPAAPQPTVAAPAKRGEAPQLAQLVKDGKLPPVEGRLPQNPVALKPVEQVGKYGGTWRMGLLGGADTALLIRTIGYEHLVRWDPEWKEVIPNVAESFSAAPDAKSYTFKLREGLKWSDGQPFTADDILFWYEDIHLVKELTPSRGNNPPTVEKVDASTVKFTFAQPNGLFLQTLSTPDAFNHPTRYPKHYLQQFHIKHNPQGVEQLAKEANQDGWVKLFQTKGGAVPGTAYDARWSNKDLPTLHGWLLTTAYGSGGTRVVAERNPFYWKVDTEGNQLPYIDRVTYEVAQDAQTLVLKALNGEIDMQDRHIATLSNKAVFADNQQKGGYGFFETLPATMNQVVIALNLTHKDPVKRQIFQNKDFRIGLSHALDRQEIIDVVYVSQGEPWQAAPRRETPFYDERMAKQYTEYDLKKANEYLDRAFPQKDGQGFRLGPDGKRIFFVIEFTSATAPDRADALKLVQGYWQKVGVDAQIKEEDRSLLGTRKTANEHDATAWDAGGGLDVILYPYYYFPQAFGSDFARAWEVWYNNPSGAGAQTAPEEPPPAPKRQMELYRQLEATSDPGKQIELMKQVLAIAREEFYTIGLALPPNGYGLVKNNFKNVPKSMPGAYLWPTPAPTNPSQYFIQ